MLCFNALISLTLILSVNPSTAIEKTKVYGRESGSITLLVNQQPTEKVTSIIWKHNKDKAAEWFEEDGVSTPTYYPNYINVTILNMKTLSLTISDLQPKFMGEYSAEVNNKDPSKSWDLIILAAVRKPAINFKDVCNVTSCTLTCEGETSQKLGWYDADGRQISSDSTITVQKKDQDMEYTCQLSNEVSNATSSVKVPRLGDPGSNSAGLAVGIALFIIAIIIAFIFLTLFRCKPTPGGKRRRTSQEIRNLWAFMPCIHAGTGTGTDAETGHDENHPMIPTSAESAAKSEEDPGAGKKDETVPPEGKTPKEQEPAVKSEEDPGDGKKNGIVPPEGQTPKEQEPAAKSEEDPGAGKKDGAVPPQGPTPKEQESAAKSEEDPGAGKKDGAVPPEGKTPKEQEPTVKSEEDPGAGEKDGAVPPQGPTPKEQEPTAKSEEDPGAGKKNGIMPPEDQTPKEQGTNQDHGENGDIPNESNPLSNPASEQEGS